MADSLSKRLLRESVTCPSCQKRVSLHFLRYKHVCRKPAEVTDENRAQALEAAVARMRQRLGQET
jgi:hypothetical protein